MVNDRVNKGTRDSRSNTDGVRGTRNSRRRELRMSTTTTTTSSYREYALKQITPPKRRTGRNLLRLLLAFLF